MKILFFTYDFPYPTNSGGKTRAYNLLKFAKKDAEITLFSFVRKSFDPKYIAEIKKNGISDVIVFPRKSVLNMQTFPSVLSSHSFFHALYFDKNIAKQLLQTVEEKKIDIVHLESFYTGFFLNNDLRNLGKRLVFGTENIEHMLYEEYAAYHPSVPLRMFFASQAKKIKREEETFYRLADCVLAVTNAEKSYITSHGGKRVMVIENGVNTTEFSRDWKRPKRTLLFVGNFSYFPNVDAMRWFMKEVFPFLSDVKIIVVGKRSQEMPFLRSECVTTVEYIEEIRDIYEKGTIFISPVRIGGGTNFKILEAIASKLPVVALSERVGSFAFVHKKEMLIADSAVSFAENIRMLLESDDLQKKLAESAFQKIKKEYEWTEIGERLYNTWKSLL